MSVSCMYHIYSNRYICTYRKGRGRSSKRCLSVDTYILGANVCAVKGGDSNSGSLVEEKKLQKVHQRLSPLVPDAMLHVPLVDRKTETRYCPVHRS